MNDPDILGKDSTRWHALTTEECLQELGTDTAGLGDDEAQMRLHQHGPNRLAPPARRSALVRFMLQFHNVLVYVLFMAAAVTGALGMWIDTAVIAGVVLINAVVGFLQEGKAERALEAVRNMLSSIATVMRHGQRMSTPADSLVPGDVVLLEAGDKVPADIRLLDAVRLQIDEAMLTGESVPASKSSEPVAPDALLGDRKCMAYSGTFVTGGQCSGVVVTTGEATELGRINQMLSEVQTLQTPLTRQMDQFGRWLTMAILIIAGATFAFGASASSIGGIASRIFRAGGCVDCRQCIGQRVSRSRARTHTARAPRRRFAVRREQRGARVARFGQ